MGGRYAQSVHSSRCPPKAAVRQRTMARSTLRCCPLIHRRLRSMNARPAVANQIGHLEGRPVHLFALLYLVFQLERVQRTRGCVEVPLGEMEIDGRLFQVTGA